MQIVALGGGAVFGGSRGDALGRYVLAQSGKRRPRVCFVPTASGDAASYVRRVAAAVSRLGGQPSHLSLFEPPSEDFTKYLCRHDVIFVGGGNTRNLLSLWRLWGLDRAIRMAYERGIVIAGISAGALCWFRAGLTDSFPGRYVKLAALGWLPGSFCPHFDSEPRRRPIYKRLIGDATMPSGYGVDDGVALHFVGSRLSRAVTSGPEAGAIAMRRRNGRVVETRLATERLS